MKGENMDKRELAKYIDSSLLNVDSTYDDLVKVCELAKKYEFATVAIANSWIPYAKKLLDGSPVGIDSPVGFPNGYSTTEAKKYEIIDILEKGATEVDVVMNITWLKSRMYNKIENELEILRNACKKNVFKVIIEAYYLTDEEKAIAAELVVKAKADFVKTSTGFAQGGATVEDVKLLYDKVGGKIKVKASGGIKTYDEAMKFLEIGASRLGASNAHLLMED